ncbi:MAG TPA: GNAT family N-acetyltransferase [Ktedonobacterales bacterium]|jgi:ribosomal protein S18 acetylase RimI-like enzyme
MWNGYTTDDGWRITVAATNDEAYAALNQERVVNCFALADLLPPFRQYTRISLARHEQTGQQATLLIVEHPDVYVLATSGHAAGVAALLAHLGLPAFPLLQALPEHWPLLASRYELPASPRDLLRMRLTAQTFQRPARPIDKPAAERLIANDLPALLALYDLFPASHFRPALLDEGVFYGVHEGAGLVAAGGTHIVALPYGLAVLGNIFTHPDRRGRGYAQAITAALAEGLLAQGCQDVMLNVEADNAPAVHVYTKLGFEPHCHIWSASARRRA